jgi:hypothetical protein
VSEALRVLFKSGRVGKPGAGPPTQVFRSRRYTNRRYLRRGTKLVAQLINTDLRHFALSSFPVK